MSGFENQVATGTATLRDAGLLDDTTEVFMPDVDMIQYEPAPLDGGARIVDLIEKALMGVILLGLLGGLGYAIHASFFSSDVAESYLATKIFYLILFGWLVLMACGALLLVAKVISILISFFFKAGIRQKFVRIVEGTFASSPGQYLERGWTLDGYEFYALDTRSGMYFDYGLMTNWQVRAVPLTMVQRFEHIRDTETVVTSKVSSSNRVSSSASSQSKHRLRLHALDHDDRPVQIVVPFGSDERHLQDWITALNAA